MATPADERLLQLLDKWLKSLDLHVGYSSLDDEKYWRVQPWVEHQRPTRWILDLARQKTLALRAQVEARIEAGDTMFADSLELMTFLANLIGSEHIERFIPAADSESERPLGAVVAAASKPAAAPSEPVTSDPAPTGTREMPGLTAVTATREMPKFTPPPRAAAPVATPTVARSERKTSAVAAKAAPKQPARKTPPPTPRTSDAVSEKVVADAVRLVQWGRKWYELPELIARMADRPPLPEVRRILNDHKHDIDVKAGKT